MRKLLMMGGALAVMMTGASQMAMADTDDLDIQAVIVATLDLDCSLGLLNFGSIDPGTGGTVTISTAGVVTPGGGTAAIPASGAAAGACTLVGEPNFDFEITIPASLVTNGTPADDMVVNNFTIDAGGGSGASPQTGTLDGLGDGAILVGADLVVANAQTADTYNGTVTITAVYD